MMAFSIFARKFDKNFVRRLKFSSSRYSSTQIVASEQTENVEQSETVEYPPILDLSKKAEQERSKFAWHEEVKNVTTTEGKLLKVNMPYYYGLRTTPLENDEYHYNCLPFMQHWTRTQIEYGLPSSWYQQPIEEIDSLVDNIRDEFSEAIAFQYNGYR